MKIYFFYSWSLILYFLPHLVFAQGGFGVGTGGGEGTGSGGGGGTGQGTGDSSGGASTVLKNPLGESSLIDFFQSLLAAVMILAVPIIVFFIILAGFKYVTARGNAAQVEEAHKALLYAILGGVLILGAQALLVIIKSTVDSFGS